MPENFSIIFGQGGCILSLSYQGIIVKKNHPSVMI